MCKQIHQGLKTDTLVVFLEEKIAIQSIQSRKSWISSYDIMNRGPKKSTNAHTSKKIEIAFGIMFENISNKFVKT